MRRLPVYFLMDISDSMVGEPLQAVQNGLAAVAATLRSDPYALETVHISVIAFAGKARELVPLTDICLFNPPVLPVGGGTSLGDGLELLMRSIDKDVRQTTADKKGDWKPVIFLFTDGAPTDDPSAAIEKWNKRYRKNVTLTAITFDDNADVAALERITDNVLTLKDITAESFKEFFRWISASLKVSSIAAADGREGRELPARSINLEKAVRKEIIDERFLLIPVKCSSARKLWLGKYSRNGGRGWKLVGAYPVDEENYRAFGGGSAAGEIDLVNTDRVPECPVCKSSVGVFKCAACGQLGCWNENMDGNCPWCGTKIGEIRQVDSLNVNRSRG